MRAKHIKGYPVVALDDGSLLGKIQDLTVNPADKKVEGLLVGDKSLVKGRLQIIPFRQVQNIGKDVIIIKSKEGLVLEEEKAQEGLLTYYSFSGNSVISDEGDYIAKIQDFTFSTETGAMESLLLYDTRGREKNNKNVYLAIEGVLKLGRDYVITKADYVSFLREEDKEEEPGRIRIPVYSLEMRAIEFSLNKEAAHTVKDIHGEVIIEKGEKVTHEVIDKARAKGRLYQVLFAAGVGELLDSIDYTVEKLDKGSALLLQAWQNLKDKSRYIFKGTPAAERATGGKEAEEQQVGQGESGEPGEMTAPEIMYESEGTEDKNRPVSDFLKNIQEIWSRLEKEISQGGKELAQESREKMKKYILHKRANYAVRDIQGHLLVEPGEQITSEIIEEAEAQNKIPALFLAAATQEVEDSLNTIRDKINTIFR